MKTFALVFGLLGSATIAGAQGAYGPYHDRAERDQAFHRLSPEEQMKAAAWAAAHPEAARKFRGKVGANAQSMMSDEVDSELQKLTPEQRREIGADIEVPEK
jgi:hypothetical protein